MGSGFRGFRARGVGFRNQGVGFGRRSLLKANTLTRPPQTLNAKP